MMPLSTSPAPPPTPNVAEISPMPEPTFSRGNSSRMMPKASGKIAPPAPCTARPRISTASDVDSAEISVPAPSTSSTITSRRSLPNMSPMRPRIGVKIEAVSR